MYVTSNAENTKTFNRVSCIFLLIILGLSLINSKYFIAPSLFAYYSYCLTASIFSLFIGAGILLKYAYPTVAFQFPFYLIFTYVLYVSLNGLAYDNLNLRHLYIAVAGSFFLSSFLVFATDSVKLDFFFNGILFLAAAESLICIVQFFGLSTSMSTYFTVTGTWTNPNVTAMFLAMTLPIALQLTFRATNNQLKLYYAVFISIIVSIFMLKCRTAMIGSTIAALIVLNHHFNLKNWLRNKPFRLSRVLFYSLICIFLLTTANVLYRSKQASADGRILIWKLSYEMFIKNPLFGVGYGRFGQQYNLEQATYVQKGLMNDNERLNATNVKMAYNEFLENSVEGGVIGLLLFGSLTLSLLMLYPKEQGLLNNSKTKKYLHSIENEDSRFHGIAAYAGTAAFVVMCVFNFAIIATPVFCLLIIYAAILLANNNKYLLERGKSAISNLKLKTVLSIACLLSCWTLINTISKSNADAQAKKAKELAQSGNFTAALTILAPLQQRLKVYDAYWILYGNILYDQQMAKAALEKYNKAKMYTSSADLYVRIGKCHTDLKEYNDAVKYFVSACQMEPNRLFPKEALMMAYFHLGQKANAIKIATEIINTQTKKQTEAITQYKSKAQEILKSYALNVI